MQDLTVSLIQTELVWQDIQANLDMLAKKIDAVTMPTDLVILPEMFSTGFSMEAPALAEPMDGRAVTWIRSLATAKGVTITGSLMIEDNNMFYNRLMWAQPDGQLITYDKKHLFRYAGEEKVYTAGNRLITAQINGWRIRPFICYDLRFPIWCRNLNQAYDLAVFVANWPQRRAPHWQALLRARAIENLSYVIGLNRVGVDGNGFDYSGDSAVIDPQGNVLFEKSRQACIHTIRLEKQTLITYRNSFPAWKDADGDMIINQGPASTLY